MKEKIALILGILLVVLIKAYAYYNLMGVKSGRWVMAAFSTMAIVWLFVVFIKLNNRFSMKLFLGVYTLLALIMLVDTVYFKQFNMMTSVTLFKMMGKLGDVNASLKQILSIKFLFFVMDVPLVYFMVGRISKHGIRKFKVNNFAFALLTLAVFSLAFMPSSVTYASDIKKVEFFNYHTNDVAKNFLFRKKSTYSIAELQNRNVMAENSAAKLHGYAKGKNLIVIQLESYQNFLLNREYNGQEITPFLNKLIKKDSLYFNDYHNQIGIGNTSDAEFVSNNSLFGSRYGSTYELYTRNTLNGLPWQLRDNGYSTFAVHGYNGDFWNRKTAYPYQGFEKFYALEDLKPGKMVGMGLSDIEVYKQSVAIMKKQKKPFYSFIVSLSNHHPYILPPSLKEIKLKPEHEGTLFGHYIQSARFTDKALEDLFTMLKENGLYDDTIVAIYGDHHGLVVSDEESSKFMTEFLGKPYNMYEMTHIPLLIHLPGLGRSETSDIPSGQVDFAPTMMNLMGIRNSDPYMFGQDLVNAKDGFVPLLMYTGKGSFITRNRVLEVPKDDNFNNAISYDPKTGKSLDIKGAEALYKKALVEFDKSDHILSGNMVERK